MDQDCLIVNEEYFIDNILGLEFKSGYEYKLDVEGIQICNPDILNDCLQNSSIFEYKLINILEKNKK